jgi:hypothetical protein
MQTYCLKPTENADDLQEWTAAWDRAVPSEDKEELNPLCNEVWQYMGTYVVNDQWVHQFRHRSHPRTGQRVLRNVPVTPYFARVLRGVTAW